MGQPRPEVAFAEVPPMSNLSCSAYSRQPPGHQFLYAAIVIFRYSSKQGAVFLHYYNLGAF